MHTNTRFIGIDIGGESLKIAFLAKHNGQLHWEGSQLIEHHKEPEKALLNEAASWQGPAHIAATGRFARLVQAPYIPSKQAQIQGLRYLHGDDEATLVSIGSHGFAVLELLSDGRSFFRENSRCSQGTGNFLRQLVDRFDLDLNLADEITAQVAKPASLSGRCPVILKTDMTHLANKGESREHILAGLYDAISENVQTLIKPQSTPKKLIIIGGVTQAQRVQDYFRRYCEDNGLELAPYFPSEALFFEAIGAAAYAASQGYRKEDSQQENALYVFPEDQKQLLAPNKSSRLPVVPALGQSLSRITRYPHTAQDPSSHSQQKNIAPIGEVILGLDIGSTGSKMVALKPDTKATLWEGYIKTNGDPVRAAKELIQDFLDHSSTQVSVRGFGVTGSGREIVGSLLATSFGTSYVKILNEIAAHAEGALFFDTRVDTIFEIGGQDAKYIRLVEGRVVDSAMNEACSAGTGSFIEEQGKRFSGIQDVQQLSQEALEAQNGISLGQHCSVFMAEIIDDAVAAGVAPPEIYAGIYDSIIQNYLNRVKGSRPVGQVIFCQGMPFSSDALAAAVARQTNSEILIPPNPGTVGALGIALLAKKELTETTAVDLKRFLEAQVLKRDQFICRSTKGCGKPSSLCRIDRLVVEVASQKARFNWGGNCSLWDKGFGSVKLPDRALDPFQEREQVVDRIIAELSPKQDITKGVEDSHRRPSKILMTDGFGLNGYIPLFATFFTELGFAVEILRDKSHKILKKGIERANVPYCAPMQHYHGLIHLMLNQSRTDSMQDNEGDIIFLPMVRDLPKIQDESHSVLCPIVQASPEILLQDYGTELRQKILAPVIDFGDGGYDSPTLAKNLLRLARRLSQAPSSTLRSAVTHGIKRQIAYERELEQIGQRALDFCRAHDIISVVVLGRPYTLYNNALNSNVPALLREQGALAIPVDCYPIQQKTPTFDEIYWYHGQRNLRAAHQIRREDIYSVWTTNYSCGPDSFNLHFYSYIMEGKPFAIIETDGHSGDAGTKTRIESFLHSVRQDRAHEQYPASHNKRLTNFKEKEGNSYGMDQIRSRDETVLIPYMGPNSEIFAATLATVNVAAEALPMATSETLKIGRRHTSGKECLPLSVTLGSFLARLQQEKSNSNKRYALFMPTANGPCRFGQYNIMDKLILERLGLQNHVGIWAPLDEDYLAGLPGGFSILLFAAFASMDMIMAGLLDVWPQENKPGLARHIYKKYKKRLLDTIQKLDEKQVQFGPSLMRVGQGNLFGFRSILEGAAAEFAQAQNSNQAVPIVSLVGEIYVRQDPFSNDFIVHKLMDRGIKVRFAPFTEWLEYSDYFSRQEGLTQGIGAQLTTFVQKRILDMTYNTMAKHLNWGERVTIKDTIKSAAPYLRKELIGEEILTIGGPLHEWYQGEIDGVVSVGPLECMPNKIAEAQFHHITQKEGLLSLTLSSNGDPVDETLLDNFVFEIKERFAQRQEANQNKSVAARTENLAQ